jgi:hypothetical protein
MRSAALWYTEGPVGAVGLGGYYETTVCNTCGRGFQKQVADLVVELTDDGPIWLADNDALLIAGSELKCLDLLSREGALLQPVIAHWRGIGGAASDVLQVRPTCRLHAGRVRRTDCHCNSVEEIPFNPLQLVRPSAVPHLAVLADNACTILFDAALLDVIASCQPRLEFSPAYWQEDCVQPPRTFADSDWSELS